MEIFKDSSKAEVSKHFEKWPTPSKTFVILLQKHAGKDGPVLSFGTKY